MPTPYTPDKLLPSVASIIKGEISREKESQRHFSYILW